LAKEIGFLVQSAGLFSQKPGIKDNAPLRQTREAENGAEDRSNGSG